MDAEQLFREHYHALTRYLFRYTGDSDAAADIAQEAFVRLLDHEPEPDAARSWLFTVATNLARDEWRTRTRRRELLAAGPDRVPRGDPPDGPERALQGSERRAAVRAALGTMSDKERTALLMREEGFTQREIAEAVGTTTKSVGTLTIRALNKLADRIGHEPEDL